MPCEKQSKKSTHEDALSLKYARTHQSVETGFVHIGDTTPLYANFCFILALFRSHMTDNVLEGKSLLARLLNFQTDEGAFPAHLHEYPTIVRPLQNLQMLFPLYWMQRDYNRILGNELGGKLRFAIEKIHTFLDLQEFSGILLYQRQALLGLNPKVPEAINTPKEWAQIALGAAITGEVLDIPWDETFHVFNGEIVEEWREEFETKLSPLQFLFRQVEFKDHPLMLEALLYCPNNVIPRESVKKEFSLRCLYNYKPVNKEPSRGFHLLRLLFGEHSFVCQDWKMQMCGRRAERSLDVDFTYPLSFENPMELNFFINYQPKIDIYVQGKKATLFALQDPITFERFTLHFSLIEGEGDVCGQILRGNRRAQTAPRVIKNHTAYDWQISLRTIARSDHFKIRARLTW